ncbi:MAG: hypothetical protein JWL75_487 [Parcubacteria group bacterium]|nr:hypothetical protein [Parcubacteria group bacterium]
MEAPRRIAQAKFNDDKKLLSIIGSAGGRIRAENKKAEKQAQEEMDALRTEAFNTIAEEQAEKEKAAADKIGEEGFNISEEDIIPLHTEDEHQ